MKKVCFLLASAVILLFLAVVFPAAADTSLRGYNTADKSYQYITLGTYPYEEDGSPLPVLWRVLSVENGRALLLTEYVLDAKQIIFETDQKIIEKHSFRRIDTYAESDLYAWLNTDGLDTLLGQDPLRGALVEDPDLGFLHPLTRDQYLDPSLGFSSNPWGEEINAHPDRQAVSTPYARTKNLFVHNANRKSPYWCVAIKDPAGYKFGLVGYNGHISWGAYTNIKVGGLRLALELDLTGLAVFSGSGTKEDPFLLVCAEQPVREEESTPSAQAPQAESEQEPAEASADASAAEEPEPVPESREGSALITLLGDCSVGDALSAVKMGNSYHSVVKEHGYAWPFSLVRDILAADDLTVANLEVVLTENTSHKDIKYPLRALPEHVQILTEGSIEAVNTVNNHAYDFKRAGYVDTLAVLDAAGIARFGSVYYDKEDGFDDVLVRDINGIRFGFFGISYPQNSDLKHIDALLQDLRENRHCDIIIASMHWGREGFTDAGKLTSAQLNLSRRLIDNGADVVYGHHPHVLQPMVFYRNKPILFSTGNFTFGTINTNLDTHTGIFRLTFEKNASGAVLRKLEVIPCRTGKKGDYRPTVLEDEKEREKTFQILSPKRRISDYTAAPASFRTTGIVFFNEQGEIIPDE